MRRHRTEIIVDILKLTMQDYTNKTKIVYGANLNFKLVGWYLDILNKNGLIEGNGRGYKTTEKGKKYLIKAEEINALSSALDADI